MASKHFLARCGNQNSPFCKTQREAEEWAADYLSKSMKDNSVIVYSAVSEVTRASSPVVVTQLEDPPVAVAA